MPWTPESNTPLTNGPLLPFKLEETSFRLMAEFLAGYFNDGQHVIGTSNQQTKFPMASLKFQQAPVQQELNGLAITMMTLSEGKSRRFQRDGGFWGFNPVVWKFFIRAATQNDTTGENPADLVRRGADLLYGLFLIEPLAAPLHAKGINTIRPQPPVVIPNTDYKMRSINITAKLIFPADYGVIDDNIVGEDYLLTPDGNDILTSP